MKKNYFYVILAACLWGTMGVFINGVSPFGFSTAQIAMLRAFVSLLFVTVLILCKDKKYFRIELRDVWMFFGSGIISYFLFTNCYFFAIENVGVAVSATLLYTSPIFVTVLSAILFRDKMTKRKLFCLVLAFSGCAFVSGLFSGEGHSVSPLGISVGVASGFTYALYSIFSTFALRKYNTLTVTFYTFLFGAVACLAIGAPLETFPRVVSENAVLPMLALGIVTGALPYVFYTLGLSKLAPSHAAVLATIEPVVASLFGIFLFNEASDVFTVLGIVLVLSSAFILNLPSKK